MAVKRKREAAGKRGGKTGNVKHKAKDPGVTEAKRSMNPKPSTRDTRDTNEAHMTNLRKVKNARKTRNATNEGNTQTITSGKLEPRRGRRNHESFLLEDEFERPETVLQKKKAEKRGKANHLKKTVANKQTGKTPEGKVMLDVESYVSTVCEPVVLGEGERMVVLDMVRQKLAREEADMIGKSSLYAIRQVKVPFGDISIVPGPLLRLSRENELQKKHRKSDAGAEVRQFVNFFSHPCHIKDRGAEGDEVDGGGGTVVEGNSGHLGDVDAVQSPSIVHGDSPTPRKVRGTLYAGTNNQTRQEPQRKKLKFDVLAFQRLVLAASGRRSTRVSGKRVKYAESDESDSADRSDFDVSGDGSSSEDVHEEEGKEDVQYSVHPLTWDNIFPTDLDLDESCYRMVEKVIPFKSVGVGTAPVVPPCSVAPIGRVRYCRNSGEPVASESTQSLVDKSYGGDGDEVTWPLNAVRVIGPADQVHGIGPIDSQLNRQPPAKCQLSNVADPSRSEYKVSLIKEINSGDGVALDHFATAIRQVVKMTRPGDMPLPDGEVIHRPWALSVKDTYTWYSGFDVAHGMSYVHPLVLRGFMPVHPLYHGDSPRVKPAGSLSRLPRMDPSKDYLQAALQYIRLCAVQAGKLPSPPIEAQMLVARQFQQFESMIDRIKETRKFDNDSGHGPMHKSVSLKQMVGNQSLLLSPLVFSPRRLLAGQDLARLSERERLPPRKASVQMISTLKKVVMKPNGVNPVTNKRVPVVALYDKGLTPVPLFQGKRPLKLTDMPPPYPTMKPLPLPHQRKIVYKTRAPETMGPTSSGTVGNCSDRAEDVSRENRLQLSTDIQHKFKETEDMGRKQDRRLREHERKMRVRAEMGEEAWAEEMRRREEHRLKKKAKYQTTKKCKDALEWCQDAAKFPTTQTFTQHTVIERLNRAIQVTRELHMKKQQNLHARPVIHCINPKDGGVFVRLRTDEDEVANQREVQNAGDAKRTSKREKSGDEIDKRDFRAGVDTSSGTLSSSDSSDSSDDEVDE